MRAPPEGTISRRATIDDPARTTGILEGRYVATIPIALDRAALERGRGSFEVYCAACHGLLGDGESAVARHMAFRRPRSLIWPPVSDYAPGRIFDATERGYGLMPSYRHQLSSDERWEIVGYLRALRLSQDAHLDRLPAASRPQIERALAGGAR
jgi:mono/diheme cytochrome c family protein